MLGSNGDGCAAPRIFPSTQLGLPSADLHRAVEDFLLARRAMGCSDCTLRIYTYNLARFARATGSDLAACTSQIVHRYLTDLRGFMKPVSAHQHYRTLRTFFSWCFKTGILASDSMAGVKMQPPKTLPHVPNDETVRALLNACPDTFEGRRNKVLVALLADSGLRIGEALRLRIADLDLAAGTLIIRGGKGGKDGIGMVGFDVARLIGTWLRARPTATASDYVFGDLHGRPLSRSHGTHILHRLSRLAGLERNVGPHALRHFAATSLLRKTGNLELVRRVLRHETLTMTLLYARLADSEVVTEFRRASPLDNLGVGRQLTPIR